MKILVFEWKLPLLLVFCIYSLKSDINTLAFQNCRKDTVFWTNNLPICHPHDYCLLQDEHRSHTKGFSTKTGYRIKDSNNFERSEFEVEDCTPAKIWLLIRHGTRLPTGKGIKRFSQMEKFRDEIVENLTKLKKSPLCAEDLETLKQWKWNHSISEDHANNLMPQGFKELSSIARNYQQYFPSLFEAPYDNNKFHFQHTNSERTHSSFRAFFDEIFGENAHKQMNAVSPKNKNDLLLKAYAHCPLWKKQKRLLQAENSELKKFEQSKEFLKVVNEIDLRFGFNGTFEAKRVKEIYDICRYEQAWQPDKASIWCSLLTPSQIQRILYRDDLIYYYKSSHGSELNKYVKCEAMKDMLNRLGNEKGPKTTVYFSHSAALQLFLTALGALRDEVDFKADNFAEMSIRKWKTSKISPFAGNIGIVRYKCPKHDQAKFFLNENLLKFDWCKPNGACDWRDVETKYEFYANQNCNDVFCRDDL